MDNDYVEMKKRGRKYNTFLDLYLETRDICSLYINKINV